MYKFREDKSLRDRSFLRTSGCDLDGRSRRDLKSFHGIMGSKVAHRQGSCRFGWSVEDGRIFRSVLIERTICILVDLDGYQCGVNGYGCRLGIETSDIENEGPIYSRLKLLELALLPDRSFLFLLQGSLQFLAFSVGCFLFKRIYCCVLGWSLLDTLLDIALHLALWGIT